MNNIVVKYFDPLNVFEVIGVEIQKYFPVKNIHYKRFPDDIVSTIRSLDINITSDDTVTNNDIFFSLIAITCTNIEDYRNKIRPLIKQWISNHSPSDNMNYELGVLFIQTTMEDISDNKLFNRLNLIEKIEKDFPEIKPENIFQFPIFYKSLQDKNIFYSRFIIKLQKQIISSLNLKLNRLETSPDVLYKTSKALDLYLRFGVVEFAESYLNVLVQDYIDSKEILSRLLPGNLEAIKVDKFDVFHENILTDNKELTYNSILEFRLLSTIKLLSLKHQPLLNDDIVLLHQTVINQYLFKVEKTFSTHQNLDKFIFLMIEDVFMKLPLLVSNLDKETTVNEMNKRAWNLFLGKLASIKRQAWGNMIDSCGMLPFKLNDNPLKNKNHAISVIDNMADTESSILNQYINLTQNIVSYWRDLMPITIDLLSADIGIVFNKFGQHEKTTAILHSTFEYYYNVMKWEDLSIQLLDVYIDSLEKLYKQDLHQKIIIEDELVPIVTVLANCYLNFTCLMNQNNKSLRSLNRKLETWGKFLELNANTDLTYPLERLINLNIDTVSKLGYDSEKKCHYYYIDMSWDWLIDTQIILNLDLVKLKMRNLDCDTILVFEAFNAKLTETNSLTLRCYNIEFGMCELVSIDLFSSNNNTIFMKEFDDRLKINIIPLYAPQKFNVAISEPLEYRTEQIVLDVNYENYKTDDKIGLKYEIVEPSYLSFKDNGNNVLDFVENDLPSELEFEINDEKFEFSLNIKIVLKVQIHVNGSFKEKKLLICQFSNPLSISVSLIPKVNVTYLNVNVDCVYEPFNILSSALLEQKEQVGNVIKANTNLNPSIKNIVLPNNALSSFKSFFTLSSESEGKLIYVIKYKTMRSAIQDYLTKRVFNNYQDLSLYKEVWEQYILPIFQYHTNQFIHFKTIKLKVYDETEFNKYLQTITIEKSLLNAKFLKTVLMIYRKLFDGIQLEESDHIWEFGKLQTFNKAITSDEYPCQNTLFTITLNKTFMETNLKMGDCYKYEFLINKKGHGMYHNSKEDYECVVSDEAASEDWLVNGFNNFMLNSEAEEEKFEIGLIPIKRGYLKYPNIQILKHSESSNKDYTVDFININENIIVI